MVTFEGYDRRINKINDCITKYGLVDLDNCKKICDDAGINVEAIVREIQPICFDNAVWAYTLGTAIALTKKEASAEKCAENIGIGLQAFCVKGSVADSRQVGIGHGKLASMLLNENTKCFALLAGHESFAAAEGALGIVRNANKARKTPLRVILNGLGKDAAYLISRINGFTYIKTRYNFQNQELEILDTRKFSNSYKSEIKVYGCEDVTEGVAVMKHEGVDISITGNSTNPVRFTHPTAGIYKKWCVENNKNYFSVASGGGTGRTLHPDNVGSGSASYGLTDTLGRMHADAQFAGSSSVPAHVDMMGYIGMGNNPMVGATVSLAVKSYEALK